MADLLMGKEVAARLNESTSRRVDSLKERGINPVISIVRVGENPSDIAYENGACRGAEALGIGVKKVAVPPETSVHELLEVMDELNEDSSVHGVLMFRPLPPSLKKYEDEIRNRLIPAKDVDCMTDLSCAGVYMDKALGMPPCTPQACIEILDYYGIPLEGKNVVVIGRSLVVGKPLAMMLMSRNATVTVCHTRSVDVPSIASRADILVTSAGEKGFITGEFVRPGQVVIDVSINYDPEKNGGRGGITGDTLFEEAEPVVKAITPVPGGVGAVTTAVLMEHVVRAAESAAEKTAEKAAGTAAIHADTGKKGY